MNRYLHTYQEVVGQLGHWIFLLMIFSLPYSPAITRPLWVAWLIAWLLEGRWLQRENYRIERAPLAILAGSAVFLGWEMISAAWSIEPQHTWDIVGRHVNLLCIPIITMVGLNRRYQLRTTLLTLLLTSVTSIGVYAMIHYWIYNPAQAFDQHYAGDLTAIDWRHMSRLTLSIKHRLYYALPLGISLCTLPWLEKEMEERIGRWQAIVLAILSAGVLVTGIWMSGSRQVILILLLLGALYLIGRIPRRGRIPAAVVILAAAIAAGYVYLGHTRTEDRNGEDLLAYHPEQEIPSAEPRLAIWHTVWAGREDYPPLGLGAGCDVDYLAPKYEEHGWTRFIYCRYNAHNQYMSEWMELGIAGAIYFAIFWLSIPGWFQRERGWAMALWSMIALSCLTENVLARIEGIILVAIVWLMMLQMSDENEYTSSVRPD